MSLLDDPRDYVILTPAIVAEDVLGNPGKLVPDPDPDNKVPRWGRVQPSSSTMVDADGQVVSTFYVFRCRDFPAGVYSTCNWDGRDWDVQGEPARHNGSDTTKHATITFKARSREAIGHG